MGTYTLLDVYVPTDRTLSCGIASYEVMEVYMKIGELGKGLKYSFMVEDMEGLQDVGECCLDGADMLLIECHRAGVCISFLPILDIDEL